MQSKPAILRLMCCYLFFFYRLLSSWDTESICLYVPQIFALSGILRCLFAVELYKLPNGFDRAKMNTDRASFFQGGIELYAGYSLFASTLSRVKQGVGLIDQLI